MQGLFVYMHGSVYVCKHFCVDMRLFCSYRALVLKRALYSPLYTLKKALYVHSKEPYICTQNGPVYILKRALYIHSKEPYKYTQK